MVCTNPYPKRVLNPNWDGNPLTKYSHVLLPCGKCLACRINRRREWTLRLLHEEIYSSSSWFVTLTYDEEHVPYDDNGIMCVCKKDVQQWIKRLRNTFGTGIRYFLNSEYGELGRPHYHAIVFNLPANFAPDARTIVRYSNHRKSLSFHSPSFQSIWSKGNVEFSDATAERCGYCAKYFVERKEIDEILVPNFTLVSRGGRSGLPGIGTRHADFVSNKVRSLGNNAVINPHTGRYVALPRTYRNRIFSEEERQDAFLEYMKSYELDDKYISMLDNHELVEANQYKAMHFKNIKSKL